MSSLNGASGENAHKEAKSSLTALRLFWRGHFGLYLPALTLAAKGV
ncbi:hypothetical protein AAH446_11830 [Erwinia sp. P6884]